MSSPEIISVIIQPDGITAKEVNPIKMPDAFFEGRKKEWNEAQNKLRTFEIEGAKDKTRRRYFGNRPGNFPAAVSSFL